MVHRRWQFILENVGRPDTPPPLSAEVLDVDHRFDIRKIIDHLAGHRNPGLRGQACADQRHDRHSALLGCLDEPECVRRRDDLELVGVHGWCTYGRDVARLASTHQKLLRDQSFITWTDPRRTLVSGSGARANLRRPLGGWAQLGPLIPSSLAPDRGSSLFHCPTRSPGRPLGAGAGFKVASSSPRALPHLHGAGDAFPPSTTTRSRRIVTATIGTSSRGRSCLDSLNSTAREPFRGSP